VDAVQRGRTPLLQESNSGPSTYVRVVLTSAAVTYRAPLPEQQHYCRGHENKSADVRWTWAAEPCSSTACNYMQFFPSNCYTHVICTHCDINGGRYTRHHLRNKTVTPLNSTNSCQQMAFIAIPPVRQLPCEILFPNGLPWLLQQTLIWWSTITKTHRKICGWFVFWRSSYQLLLVPCWGTISSRAAII